MSIFERHPKQIPEVGDVIEGYYREIGGSLHWCSMADPNWNLCYGVVTATQGGQTTIEGYKSRWEVIGVFAGTVCINNSDVMHKGGDHRIWLALPLGISRRGHFVNPPVPGIAILVSSPQ